MKSPSAAMSLATCTRACSGRDEGLFPIPTPTQRAGTYPSTPSTVRLE